MLLPSPILISFSLVLFLLPLPMTKKLCGSNDANLDLSRLARLAVGGWRRVDAAAI